MSKKDSQVPQHVLDTPANAEGDGFISLGDVWSESIVGDDGRVYSRKGDKITVEAEDED